MFEQKREKFSAAATAEKSYQDKPFIEVEQMFTDLTSEEASVIEGGGFARVNYIKALKAGADEYGNPDDTYIKIGRHRIWGAKEMSTGQREYVGSGRILTKKSEISLFDSDPGRDDGMGWVNIYPWEKGTFTATLEGSGSEYEVNYTIQ